MDWSGPEWNLDGKGGGPLARVVCELSGVHGPWTELNCEPEWAIDWNEPLTGVD